ncbi:MAG: cobalamin biosynthesis protein, partial [Oscillospiraceae bacterium]|nr:cobalamin biosynthesis protein [Oscillospiraceae bacterium]
LFSISVLSGHLGGGNVIAQRVARVIGAQCVITTATDLRGVFGVDVWASEMGLHIENPDFIKRVSAALLGGKKVGIFIDGKWRGTLPKGLVLTDESGRLTGARKTGIPSVKECDVDVGADVEAEVDSKAEADVDNEAESDVKAEADSKAEADVDNEAEADVDVGVIVSCRSVNPYKYTLKLRPKAVTLGIGCKKGTDESEIVAAVNEFLVMNKFSIDSLTAVASISIKHDEPGILKFCEREKIDFFTYTSDELNEIAGEEFSYSDFVKKTANVDCVCERAAAAHGKLIIGKTVFKGITLALSMSDWGVAF